MKLVEFSGTEKRKYVNNKINEPETNS